VLSLRSDTSYRNPFEDQNALQMNPSRVYDLYCDPKPLLDRGEADFFREKAIFFEGSRGCGKTMVLRHLSFEVQSIAAKENGVRLLDHIQAKGGVGFYLRIDNARLLSFQGPKRPRIPWARLFEHYFELSVATSFVQLLQLLQSRREIDPDDLGRKIARSIGDVLGTEVPFESFQEIDHHIFQELRKVEDFINLSPYREVQFNPTRAFRIGSLTGELPRLICHLVEPLADAKFLILIDEFENFSEAQQRALNSLIRSAGPNLGFRLAMRREGLKTLGTTRPSETLRANSDFRRATFKDVLVKEGEYRTFLERLADKRLARVPFFVEAGLTSIRKILGEEDDEEEARRLIERKKDKTLHFESLKLAYTDPEIAKLKESLRCPANPLLEQLNILYLLRGRDATEIQRSMTEYLRAVEAGKRTHRGSTAPKLDGTKYGWDYIHKYKLALLFRLTFAYKAQKEYYGFNVFCFLSSGIPRNFINLCKTAFHQAQFTLSEEEFKKLGTIPPDIQAEAARKEAEVELTNIASIFQFANELSWLAKNLGTVFAEYHRDPYLRYPETNTLALDPGSLDDYNSSVLRAAVMNSVIQPKRREQKSGPGLSILPNYTLNRLLCPVFNISYRTRGGILERYSDSEFGRMCREEGVPPHHLPAAYRRSARRLAAGRPGQVPQHGQQSTLDDAFETQRR